MFTVMTGIFLMIHLEKKRWSCVLSFITEWKYLTLNYEWIWIKSFKWFKCTNNWLNFFLKKIINRKLWIFREINEKNLDVMMLEIKMMKRKRKRLKLIEFVHLFDLKSNPLFFYCYWFQPYRQVTKFHNVSFVHLNNFHQIFFSNFSHLE